MEGRGPYGDKEGTKIKKQGVVVRLLAPWAPRLRRLPQPVSRTASSWGSMLSLGECNDPQPKGRSCP